MKFGKQISHTVRGYAGGGLVKAPSWKYKLPAFESAAKNSGLDISMETINEIVLLVNEGHAPATAAKMLADKRRKTGGVIKKSGASVLEATRGPQ